MNSRAPTFLKYSVFLVYLGKQLLILNSFFSQYESEENFVYIYLFCLSGVSIKTQNIAKYIDSKLGILSGFHILPVLVAVAVIMGHSKSIFLKFSGGKSVASGVGTILGLCPPVGLITILSWVALTYFTKIVSISSIIVILLTPVWMFVFKQPLSYVIYCLLGALYIVYLHRENIKRLLSGNENKIRN